MLILKGSYKGVKKCNEMKNFDIDILKINRDIDDISRIQKEIYNTLTGKQ